MDVMQNISKMLKVIRNNGGIAQAGEALPEDIFPTIHQLPEARHLGFGLFEGIAPSGDTYDFNAGGAMSRCELPDGSMLSWTAVQLRDSTGPIEWTLQELGINVELQEQYLLEWQEVLAEELREEYNSAL
jgi:hypothetical protein